MRLLLLIIPFIIAAGCVQTSTVAETEQQVRTACTSLCEHLKISENISAGPCIMDPSPDKDWVCDVAHVPRTSEDDLPQNQCASYLNGTAHHFVEITPDCVFIRAE